MACAVKEPEIPLELSMTGIVKKLRSTFAQFEDHRTGGPNQSYTMEDAALSAFSVFFTQSPSFLDHQRRIEQSGDVSNVQTIFGVHKTPSDNQVRNLLDPVSPQQIYPLIAQIGQRLNESGFLANYRSVQGQMLIAIDGTDIFSSEKIFCPGCSIQKLKNGKTCYRHTAITPVIVAPGQAQVIALPPEFVQPQDGQDKQDCEVNASKRWLERWGSSYACWGVTLLGDDLYCHQPFCLAVLVQGMHFIVVCKPQSHALLYEWVNDFERMGQRHSVQRSRWTGKEKLRECYSYVNQVPLCNRDDALMVNWYELMIVNAKDEMVFHNAWATSHLITDDNVIELAAAGRARWKIENENNNTLKNHGYHLEHNFGHGKQNLCALLATLNLLAFLLHTTLEWIDERYRSLRKRLPSRRTFFDNLRALLLYLTFSSWDHLMNFMLHALQRERHPAPGSG